MSHMNNSATWLLNVSFDRHHALEKNCPFTLRNSKWIDDADSFYIILSRSCHFHIINIFQIKDKYKFSFCLSAE